MKTIINNSKHKLVIPEAALNISFLRCEPTLEQHILRNAIVLIKPRMNANDLVDTIYSLTELMASLCDAIINTCGKCDECDGDKCTLQDAPLYSGELPEELRDAANISEDHDVRLTVDAKRKAIIFHGDDPHSRSLFETLPEEMQVLFRCYNLCVGALDHLLWSNEVVYGE